MTKFDWRILTPEERAKEAAHPQAVLWNEQVAKQKTCGERPGGHRWHLEIDSGRASVYCADCKAEPYPDYDDSVTMDPIPVSLTYRTEHNHTPAGDHCCDCDFWIDVTMTPEGDAK